MSETPLWWYCPTDKPDVFVVGRGDHEYVTVRAPGRSEDEAREMARCIRIALNQREKDNASV
jgi:hypothetical protein